MTLGEHDLHLTFSKGEERLQVWNAKHEKLFECEARNRTVNEGEGHYGHIPEGEFRLDSPISTNAAAYGPYYIPVLDYENHHAMRDFKREGIGLHGGGTGLTNPFADRQGWARFTHGCIRLINIDLKTVVHLVDVSHSYGGKCYLTVTP